MTSINSVTACAMLVLAAPIYFSEACATAPPSSSEGSVEVVVVSGHPWGTMEQNDMKTTGIVEAIKTIAVTRRVVFFTANQITKMPEMVGDKLGVHFEIFGAFDKCLRILEFFQAAVKAAAPTGAGTDPLDKITSATVKCGTFDTITVI